MIGSQCNSLLLPETNFLIQMVKNIQNKVLFVFIIRL